MYDPDHNTEEMSKFVIEGNLIDHCWPKIIIKENGKPDHIAITLLAHIVYWYRPVYENQPDGSIKIGKKYKSDLLQRSYIEIENMLGLTKREAQEAFQRLEKFDFVHRELRTIQIGGQLISNVLFIRLNHNNLMEKRSAYLKKCISSYAKKDEGIRQKGQGSTPIVMTYTENTPEISPEISEQQQQRARDPEPSQSRDCDFAAAALENFSISDPIEYSNMKGDKKKITLGEVYRYFCTKPFATKTIESAIEKFQKERPNVNNILKLLETICERLESSCKKPANKELSATEKPPMTQDEIDEYFKNCISVGELNERKERNT